MANRPIADYALLSDCHSAALASIDGSIDWLCFPAFDSSSVFARLLDDDAGHWSIRPRDLVRSSRRYVDDTLVLETRFETAGGVAILTDAMALGEHTQGHDLGRGAPHCLLRSIACVEGCMQIDMEYAPRPEYGLVLPLFRPEDGGMLSRGGSGVLLLSVPVSFDVANNVVCATFDLKKGQTRHFALQYRSILEEPPSVWLQEEIARRTANVNEVWRSWSRLHQRYTGPWRDQVAHSGRVLQALTYFPTGAIVAAPTTSLPESVGGDRNWDYRFTWVRDASLTLEALWVAACPDEAYKFFGFLAEAALTQVRRGADLQIMFGIRGEHDLTERTLPHLKGWCGSKPVRIGNGAWNQRQLDVYGELLSAVFQFRQYLSELDSSTLEFLSSTVDSAAARWKDKDQGIWEMRGEARHFLYSKLMCWVALDRGIQLARILRAEDKIPAWQSAREEIRSAILEKGWSETAQSFTQAFGSNELDASTLMISIVGFLPGDDPRVLATIEAIAARLTDPHGIVFRYISEDGFDSKDGAFLLCTFWLAQAQALAGRLHQAKVTFSRALSYMNDVGLLSEEVRSETRELLGNFPQAFSHIGLINAAWAISVRAAQEEQNCPGKVAAQGDLPV